MAAITSVCYLFIVGLFLISNGESFLFPASRHFGKTNFRLMRQDVVKMNLFGFNQDNKDNVNDKSNNSLHVPATTAQDSSSTSSPPVATRKPPTLEEQNKMAEKYQFMVSQILANEKLTVSKDGIEMTYTGDLHPREVKISEEAYMKGKDTLSQNILSAIQEIHTQARSLMQTTLSEVQKKLTQPP